MDMGDYTDNPGGSGTGGWSSAESAARARAAYVAFNRRVERVRAQPSWLQKLVGYTLLFAVLGIGIVLGLLAVAVGAVLAVAVAITLGVRRVVRRIAGSGHGSGQSRRDEGRANVRVIARR